MAITNYGQLKTAIQEWQLSLSDVGGNAEDFIALAHEYIFLKLRVRDMITKATLTVGSNDYIIPDDYLQHRRVTELASPRRPLEYITPKAAEYLYPSRQSGLGLHYTIEGTKLIVFPYTANDVEMSYYAKPDGFVADSDTNWLLTKFPAMYLAAGQMYAAEFLKEDGEVTKQATIVDTYIDLLNSQHMSEEYQSAEYTFLGDAP